MSAILVSIGLAIVGCDGGGDDDNGNSGVDVSGRWTGTMILPQGTYSVVVDLDQSGNQVAGTLSDGDTSYTCSGTVDGNTLILVFSFIEDGVTGIGTIAGTMSGNSMSGDVVISTTEGDTQGTFSVTRS